MPKKKRVIDLWDDMTQELFDSVSTFVNTYIELAKSNNKLYVPLKWKFYKDDINWLTFPKLVFTSWVRELWLHIITRSNGSGMWYIFKELKTLYMQEWMDAYTATKKANDTIHMFYKACDTLSLEWKPPFISYVGYYDREKKKEVWKED